MSFWIDSKSIEDYVIQIQSRSMSDPTLSDIDFKNKMAWVWTTLKNFFSDVSNIESKWRRTEEENSKLKEQLAGLRDKDRRNRERLTHDVEDTENRLRQTDNRLRDSDNRLRETEDRLNDSQRENDRLHDKLQGNVRFIEIFD